MKFWNLDRGEEKVKGKVWKLNQVPWVQVMDSIGIWEQTRKGPICLNLKWKLYVPIYTKYSHATSPHINLDWCRQHPMRWDEFELGTKPFYYSNFLWVFICGSTPNKLVKLGEIKPNIFVWETVGQVGHLKKQCNYVLCTNENVLLYNKIILNYKLVNNH